MNTEQEENLLDALTEMNLIREENAQLRARVAEMEAENATLKVRFTNITTNAKTCYPAKGQP